jgi:uncharacterized membrane protein YhiD involved in acid resistance
MPDFLLAPFSGPPINPLEVFARLVVAMVFGGLVALVYRHTRHADEVTASFSVTLVLLTILIAMVTQVIGDSVARAFSLVGALSIVRFRTVVRDTQDTAYVIFAVVVGMAAGSSNPWVAVVGIAVVACAAAIMRQQRRSPSPAQLPYLLEVRLGVGHDANEMLGPWLDQHVVKRRLVSLATGRQGMSLDVSYRAALRNDEAAAELVKALNRVDGVQSVALRRADEEN